MPVTLQQYNNIKAFLKGNPEGGYEDWANQYKPKKEKVNKEYSEEFENWWCIYPDRKSTRLNSSHIPLSPMPSSA